MSMDALALSLDGLDFSGLRGFALMLMLVPVAYLASARFIHAAFPDGAADEESAHGRDYYLGFVVGRSVLKNSADVDDLVRFLRRESYHFQLARDDGGEKVFHARNLPLTRVESHELEAGLLSGGLMHATGTRFEVDEERCVARGDSYCRFVAIRG